MRAALVFITVAILLTSCARREKQEIARLTAERDSILTVNYEKDQTIIDFLSAISEIQENLARITEKENALTVSASSQHEMVRTSREIIRSQINEIRQMMEESKKKVNELTAMLKSSHMKLENFEKMIRSLNDQLAQKDIQIGQLERKVKELTITVVGLDSTLREAEMQNAEKSRIIEEQANRLHTAYVAVGTYSDLKNKKIVTRKGGLLGIGRTLHVIPGARSAFDKIDIRTTTTIPVKAREIQIVTPHPADSYKVEHNGNRASEIVITDAEKFWSESRQLIVVTR
jgi:myosin heavy subunit